MLRPSDPTWTAFVVLWVVWVWGESEFNEEEAFVTGQLTDDECRTLAEGLRRVVLQVEDHGEERRRSLLNGSEPAPRRSGRRPKQ